MSVGNLINRTRPDQIIEIEETGYVYRIVTEYGKVNALITPSQLYPCTATNMKLDFSTKTIIFYSSMQESKWAIEERLLIGAKFPIYRLYWECLDMEKQNKLLQDTYLKILLY